MNKFTAVLMLTSLCLPISSVYAKKEQSIPVVNAIVEMERDIYTVHFSDGTAKQILGESRYSGGDLSPESKKQISDFFANQSAQWKLSQEGTKKAKSVAGTIESKNIDAITPSKVKISIVSLAVGKDHYIKIFPAKVEHNHRKNTAHKQQVETLWNPLSAAYRVLTYPLRKLGTYVGTYIGEKIVGAR